MYDIHTAETAQRAIDKAESEATRTERLEKRVAKLESLVDLLLAAYPRLKHLLEE